MSAKPPIQSAEWDVLGINLVPTTSGHRASGFGHAELVSSGELNAVLQSAYLDAKYLSDGDLSLCNVAIGAANWIPSHVYAKGARVAHDSGKLYECLTPGTTAASPGPTGTGTSITDGSVTWTYVSATNGTLQCTTTASVGTDFSVGGNTALHGDVTIDGAAYVNHDYHHAALRYDWVPLRSGYGTNAIPAGPNGCQSSGTTWTWNSQAFGQSGEQIASLDLFVTTAISATVIVDLYLLGYDGITASLEKTWTPSIANNTGYGITWTPTNTTNAYTGWMVQIRGTSTGTILAGLRVGVKRP